MTFYDPANYRKQDCEPAVAPTPVEPITQLETAYLHVAKSHERKLSAQVPAAPAESQGVERAQPVEGPRCSSCGGSRVMESPGGGEIPCTECAAPVEGVERVTDDAPARVEPAIPADIPEFAHDMYRTLKAKDEAKKDRASFWEKELFKYIWVTDGQLLCNPEKISDVIERICNEGRNSVLYIRCMKHRGGPQYNKDEYGQECTECAVQAAAQPAKPTDDRPAETIPGYVKLHDEYMQSREPISFDQWLAERTGRSETRIEVLEAALRKIVTHPDTSSKYNPAVDEMRDIARAALAAPSGEKP